MNKYQAKIFYNKENYQSISIVIVEPSTNRTKFIPLVTTGSYLDHNNSEIKTAYLLKQTSINNDKDWNDPFSYSFWDRWILWSKHTLLESVDLVSDNFNIDFV